jgi:hypothetical protein
VIQIKAITAEARRRRENAGKSDNREGAKNF